MYRNLSQVSRPLPLVDNPQNRFDATYTTWDVEALEDIPRATLHVYEDKTRRILATNDSPDVGFRWSVNPYRGCTHACSYCYARPTHEYLSFGAGTDFERKIVVKPDAPALLREAFQSPKWKGELVVLSGVTDCYQPLESKMKLTRGLLEVCLQYRNPVGIITKSPIVERDVDLLAALAEEASVRVSVSIPFWKKDVARAMEPNVTTPERRMRIVERLAKAGVPVGVSVSPIVPGLNDEDIGEVLEAAKDAGAAHAFYVLLRLPGAVQDVFTQRLREALPLRADKVLNRVRETRGGKLYDARWSARGTGEGVYAQMVATLFDKTARRLGLRSDEMNLVPTRDTFRRPEREHATAPEPPTRRRRGGGHGDGGGQTSFGF